MNPLIARVKNVKLITFIGTAIISLGLFLACYCSSLWQLFLTHGLLYGIGSSLYYFPIMSIASTYFDRHRGLVHSFWCGRRRLVMAPVLQVLYDIRGALRILALGTSRSVSPLRTSCAAADSTPAHAQNYGTCEARDLP
ncbi:hypothetical protein C8R44DRAFT_987670 [Mycena epipterygia]|nr:hypothetical protein C8R44DRAFT_987670 [Mycena epipterygia]